MYKVNGKEYQCSVSVTNEIFNDKYKLGIIWYLLDGEKRYKELHEALHEITQKTLTVKLRELEKKELIRREVFPEVPPKVVYSLTPIGQKLRDVLNAMHLWGIEYTKECGEIIAEPVCTLKLQ